MFRISMTWVDAIALAMARHDGQAHLNRIYDEAAFLYPGERPANYERMIQATIQSHSSDSDCFRSGGRDLFYSVLGKGEGVWGLRNKTVTAGELFSDGFLLQLMLSRLADPEEVERLKAQGESASANLLVEVRSTPVLEVAASYRPTPQRAQEIE